LNESSLNLNDGSIYRKMVLRCLASRVREKVKKERNVKADKTTNYDKTLPKDYLKNVTKSYKIETNHNMKPIETTSVDIEIALSLGLDDKIDFQRKENHFNHV